MIFVSVVIFLKRRLSKLRCVNWTLKFPPVFSGSGLTRRLFLTFLVMRIVLTNRRLMRVRRRVLLPFILTLVIRQKLSTVVSLVTWRVQSQTVIRVSLRTRQKPIVMLLKN